MIVVLFLVIVMWCVLLSIFNLVFFSFKLVFLVIIWLLVNIVIFFNIVLWWFLKLGVLIAVIFIIFCKWLIIRVVKVFFLIFLVNINNGLLEWVICFNIGIKFCIKVIFLLVIRIWGFLREVFICFMFVVK